MGVLVYDGPDGTVLDLIPSNQGDVKIRSASAALLQSAPFFGTYYVDRTFVGTSTGSQSAPFTTIAAAFAAGVAAGVTNGIIYLATNGTTENVTFPLTGNWEIATTPTALGFSQATLTGNVDVTCSAIARRTFTRMTVSGNVSGNAPIANARFTLQSAAITGTLTLTGSAGGFWRATLQGLTPEQQIGTFVLPAAVQGVTNVTGAIYSQVGIFFSAVTFSQSSQWEQTAMPSSVSVASGSAADLYLYQCTNQTGSIAFNGSGLGQLFRIFADGPTLSEMGRYGVNTTNTVTVTAQTGGRSARLGNQVGNVGATNLCGPLAASLMVCEASLTLLTPGTAGNAQLRVIYTGLTGALQTRNVGTTLNVAGAAGSEAGGVLPFSQNGATLIQFDVTGITTAGALSYEIDVAVRQAS